jgi:large subunit ribosomal protein L5
MKQLGLTNTMRVPRLEKIVLNSGLGEAIENANAPEAMVKDMAIMAGQRPVITRSRKAISNFHLRVGMRVGCMVTIRGDRMYHFIDRLFTIAIPRVRDFRGLSRSAFDGRGNYSIGFDEQLVFPEIDYSAVDRVRGFQVTIVTSAPNDSEGMALLEKMGCPFHREVA